MAFFTTLALAGALNGEALDGDFGAACDFVGRHYAYLERRPALDWPAACAFHRQEARALQGVAWLNRLELALNELADAHVHLSANTRASTRLIPSQSDVRGRWQGERAVLDAVREPSAAHVAGLRSGDQILSVDGQAVARAVETLLAAQHERSSALARDWALQRLLAGRHEQAERRLEILRDGRRLSLSWQPQDPPRAAGLLSQGRVGAVAWIRPHNSLGDEALIPAFDAALRTAGQAQALVLDLRDTPSGGNSLVARGLMGRLVDARRPYQRHLIAREGPGIARSWVEELTPRSSCVCIPLVLLVGPWTGSMGEGLAIGLNAARGAPVLGRPMAGLLGALDELELPAAGLRLRLPTEALFHVDGRPREAFLPEALAVDSAELELQAALARAATLIAKENQG